MKRVKILLLVWCNCVGTVCKFLLYKSVFMSLIYGNLNFKIISKLNL